MTANCRSCGRLAHDEAFFCSACGGDVAIKAESCKESATDHSRGGAALFAPASASIAEMANGRSRPTARWSSPVAVPVELVIVQTVAGLVGLYFLLKNLRVLPPSIRFASEDLEFGGSALADTALALVVGGGFLYSLLPLQKGQRVGRTLLLALSAAIVAGFIRSSWGPFASVTFGQMLVILGCVVLAGLLVFSPKLNAHLALERTGAGGVPDSVRSATTLALVFAGLSAMLALALLPKTTFGWQKPILGLVVLGTAGIVASLARQLIFGDSLVRMKLSVAVVACCAAAVLSDISPFSTTSVLAAGASALVVLWLGDASRSFFGDTPLSLPSLAAGFVEFQRISEGGMRTNNPLTSGQPVSTEPEPLRLVEVGPVGEGEERDCRTLEIAIAAKTFLPYSWDFEPPREGYVVTAQIAAPCAMDLQGSEGQPGQGFRGTSTLALGSTGLLGVGVRGISHAGAINPKGTVIAWALPYRTVSGIRVVVDDSDQEVVVLDLRSGGRVRMRKPRLLMQDSWEKIPFSEFLATVRLAVERNSVVGAAPRARIASSASHPVPVAAPTLPRGLVGEYLSTLKRFADFSGRSGSREFWFFTLANGAISLLLSIGWYLSLAATFAGSMQGGGGAAGLYLVSALFVGFGLITLVPGIAVTVRRLHDTGRNGVLWLVGLVPLVGLVLIYFVALPSDPGDNRYGPRPN